MYLYFSIKDTGTEHWARGRDPHSLTADRNPAVRLNADPDPADS